MSFCRRCGAPLTVTKGAAYKCQNGHEIFANSSPCARILVLTPNNEFVFQIRGIEPYKGQLDTFGGFVEQGESLEDAAVRELYEEAGISREGFDELRFISSGIAPYPYDGEDLTSLVATFFVRLKTGVSPTSKDEVDSIKIIPVDKVQPDQLTTPDIRTAIQKVIEMLQKGLL